MGGKGGQERGGEGEERGGEGREGKERAAHFLGQVYAPGRKGIRRKIPWVASVKELWSSRSSCFCQLFPVGSPWYYTREVY